MAKASLTLPNGTAVEIEGSTQDVKELLDFYGGTGSPATRASPKKAKKATPKKAAARESTESETPDLTGIVNVIKDCDAAEDIETRILDKTSQVDRTLLPLYIVHEYLGNKHALSSGDITKITTQLSVPVSQPAASRTLSGTASKYVIGDTARKKGSIVRYKLNRRGLKYLKSVISGESSE